MSLAHDAHHPITSEAAAGFAWRAIRERTTRGLLTFNAGAISHLEGGLWAVRSHDKGGFWRVDLDAETCDCPDYEHRAGPLGIACKHVYAVAIAHAHRRARPAAQKGKAGELAELASLEDRYQHELMDEDDRQELRERILRLREKLGVSGR